MPNLPAEVFVGVLMPYVGYKKKIMRTLRRLSKGHYARIQTYKGLLNTVKWRERTWKEAALGVIRWETAFYSDLTRVIEESEELMVHHDSALDYIKSLSIAVRAMIRSDHYQYLVYAVRKTDRTISRREFLEGDERYVEIEVGKTFIVGVLVDESRTKEFLREMLARVRAEPKYDLVGDN